MTDSSSGATPTSVIVSEFIRAYYNALSNEPQSLYAFYEEDSTFSRFEEGETSDNSIPAQGQLAIHEAVSLIPYTGCKVRIETTDAHDSSFGCVIVIVTGIIVLVGQHPRTFVQTFVLQPLVLGSDHFYVRNDIARYTSKITPTVTPTPTPAPATTPVVNHVETHTPQPQTQSQSRPSSPKKQSLAAPPSPQAAPIRAPPSPIKPVAEPIVTPEPLPVRPVSPAVPKSPQRTPEPAPVVASPPPEESPVAAVASPAPAPAPAPAATPVESKPQRVRKVKREKPAAAAAAATPAAESAAPAAAAPAAAPVEVKQEPKAPVKVAEKKAVAKPVVQQPPRPTTWASRLFNAAKDGPAGAKPAEETTETAAVEQTPHVNGDATATTAAAPAQPTTTEQPARKPRSTKRPSSGKSESYKTQELHSLWVNNIPSTVTQPELTTLFSAFGALRPIRLVSGKTYCFVDYLTTEGADNALAARPLRIQGAELSVDKKLVKQTPATGTRPTSAAASKASASTTPTTTAPLDDGFQKPTAGRSRAYKQRVASENKAAAAQQQQSAAPTQPMKKNAPTNGAPRK